MALSACNENYPYIEVNSEDWGKTKQCSVKHGSLRCMRDGTHDDGYHTSYGQSFYWWTDSDYDCFINLRLVEVKLTYFRPVVYAW